MDDILDPQVMIKLLDDKVGKIRLTNGQLNFSCPFHTDKTPSAFLSLKKGLYKCFSCNAGYNIYVFCRFLGIEKAFMIPFYTPSDVMEIPLLPHYEDIHIREKAESLIQGLQYFMDADPLSKNKIVGKFLDKKLGIGHKIPFACKFHPERESLIFRGQTVVERFLPKDSLMRYQNHGPVNLMFDDKLETPFHNLVLVEGIMDFLKLYNAGYSGCAALLTTGITNTKLMQIAALCKRNLFLAFDADDAGIKALHEQISKVSTTGLKSFVYTTAVVNQKDFGDCGRDEIDEVMFQAMTYEQFCTKGMDQYLDLFNLTEFVLN